MTLRPRANEADPLTSYLEELGDLTRRGDAREESYYSSLEALLQAAAAALGHRNVKVTTIPKRTQSCQLDFQVWRGGRVAGYVEAKHPRTDLAKALGSEQVQHYLKVFPNLLLTNFYRFLLLRGDDPVADVEIAQPYAGLSLGCVAPLAVQGELLDLLAAFFDGETPRATSAADLASALARRTRILATRVEQVLADETAPADPTAPPARTPNLTGFYRIFADHLIRGLTRREFADLYAQTVAYGLLIARWRAEGPFTRRTVFDAIPPTLGLLRDLFRYTALGTPPPEIAWVIEDLVELLAASPVPAILHRAYHESNGRDPILHFYETFLESYDRDLRRRRGVYYTPLPLASFVVRSVHHLLAARLGLPGGLANPAATLLDPAAGTLTFLVEAFRVAIEAYRAEAGEGGLAQLVSEHLLRHFHGFELMMAPYVIGHLKIGLMLAEQGLPLDDGQRVQLYLTDSLEREPLAQSQIPGVESLSRESQAAARIKLERPIAVVLGNPPYSGHSASASPWLRALIADGYRRPDGSRCAGGHEVDGAPLGERNPKWLQDDYVKFLRYAQWKIDQNGWGIAALVTNHGYLANPTFRGLRRSLLDSFDEIYLLDLGGSRLEQRAPGETAPDDNVFPGVSRGIVIALLVKLRTRTGGCRVLRAELRGRRAAKLRHLDEHHAGTVAWTEIAPAAPAYLFHARDAGLEREYRRGLALDEIFPLHSAGVVTARDGLALAFDEETLRQRMRLFQGPLPDDLLARALETPLHDTGSWRLATARRRAREDASWPERLTTLLFRPFDHRHLLYADYWVERPRRQVMRHLLGTGTSALIAPRQHKEAFGALVTAGLAGHKAVSAADVNSVFPLILQPEGLFGRREPNLAPGLLERLAALYGRAVAAEEVLAYVYGVLYSPGYRARYAALLRRDFARVPFARDAALFEGIAVLGQELVEIHLGRSQRLWPRAVRFPVPGSGKLGPPELLRAARPRDGRVVVNAEGQAFEGIAPEVWEYRIGGFQVLPRWLAARAGRRLTLAEIEAFRQTAAALQHTLELERRLDGPVLAAAGDPAALAPYSGSDSRSTSRRP